MYRTSMLLILIGTYIPSIRSHTQVLQTLYCFLVDKNLKKHNAVDMFFCTLCVYLIPPLSESNKAITLLTNFNKGRKLLIHICMMNYNF